MPDQNQTNTTTDTPMLTSASDVVVSPDIPDTPNIPASPISSDVPAGDTVNIMKSVGDKIREVHNILVALSSDPSVDEIAAAIGLSLCLDRAGKRATAIYSGKTPNALEFLKPEETFETNSDVLRDFVIALSKDKADHLRYKLDGDFVKIFITPYKSRIDEDDLEFSYGDFNIELVLALDVTSGIDLDDALREHGRVMHDATVVNITNGNPGKFGDIEWSDKTKSSVSEMVADLLYDIGGDKALEGEEATALLTGIVASTEHFTNNMTTAAALQTAAHLIESGADRELISENIGLDAENMFFTGANAKGFSGDADKNNPSLDISHTGDGASDREPKETSPKNPAKPDDALVKEPDNTTKEPEPENSELLADLQAAANSLSHAGAEATPEVKASPLRIDENGNEITNAEPNVGPSPVIEPTPEPVANSDFALITEPTTTAIDNATSSSVAPSEGITPTMPVSGAPVEPSEILGVSEPTNFAAETKQETVIAPSEEFASANETFTAKSSTKYGQMLEAALAEANAKEVTNTSPAEPLVSPAEVMPAEASTTPAAPAETLTMPAGAPTIVPIESSTPSPEPLGNPALSFAPPVATEPEINGVPEINYMSAPGEDILPPPPAPPIDLNSPMPTPASTPNS